jgi:hypothetical protein
MIFADVMTEEAIIHSPGFLGDWTCYFNRQWTDPIDPYFVRGVHVVGYLPIISEDKMAGTAASMGVFSGQITIIGEAGSAPVEDNRILAVYSQVEIDSLITNQSQMMKLPFAPNLGYAYLYAMSSFGWDGADLPASPWGPQSPSMTSRIVDDAWFEIVEVSPVRDGAIGWKVEQQTAVTIYVGDAPIQYRHFPAAGTPVDGTSVQWSETVSPSGSSVGGTRTSLPSMGYILMDYVNGPQVSGGAIFQSRVLQPSIIDDLVAYSYNQAALI